MTDLQRPEGSYVKIYENLDDFAEWEHKARSYFRTIGEGKVDDNLEIEAAQIGFMVMNGYVDGKEPEEVAMEVAMAAGLVSPTQN